MDRLAQPSLVPLEPVEPAMFDPAGAVPQPPLFPDVALDPESLHEAVEVDGWDESREVVGVVDVELSHLDTWIPFESQGMTLVVGDRVVVATTRGLEMGRVCRPSRFELRRGHDLPKVIRRAGVGDERQSRRNLERAQEAREFADRRIRELELPMKLVAVEILHGGSRAMFHFESDDRIDFRSLVRDLSDHLRLRVDMRQVGVRDAAKTVGALGRCGQPACCARYLRNFCPVSIRMAKDQNLVLSPEKVSGVCGRLLCCLSYEYEGYRALKAGLPKVGRRILTPAGEGQIKDVDVLRRRVTVELFDGDRKVFAAEELGLPPPGSVPGPGPGSVCAGPARADESSESDAFAGDERSEAAARSSSLPPASAGVGAVAGGEGPAEAAADGPGEGVAGAAAGGGGPSGSSESGAPREGRRRRRGRGRRRHDVAPGVGPVAEPGPGSGPGGSSGEAAASAAPSVPAVVAPAVEPSEASAAAVPGVEAERPGPGGDDGEP
ncbi:MAG: hypothetical protein JXB32_04845 [Deltaproteobacteria bacterium]|nr:hypothetical protein [Deltaproteobacteria bacterium]